MSRFHEASHDWIGVNPMTVLWCCLLCEQTTMDTKTENFRTILSSSMIQVRDSANQLIHDEELRSRSVDRF